MHPQIPSLGLVFCTTSWLRRAGARQGGLEQRGPEDPRWAIVVVKRFAFFFLMVFF